MHSIDAQGVCESDESSQKHHVGHLGKMMLVIQYWTMDQQIVISERKGQAEERKEKGKKEMRAYCLTILSAVCSVFMQFCIKKLSINFAPSYVLGIRSTLLILTNTFLLLYNGLDFNITHKSTLILLLKRSLASATTVTLYLGSLKYIPLGVASTLFNTSPILTIFVSTFFFKKGKIHFAHLIITGVSFIGVVMVMQPDSLFEGNGSDDSNVFPAYMMALSSAFFYSFSLGYMHELSGKCNELVMLHYAYMMQGIFNYTLYFFTHPNQSQTSLYLSQLTPTSFLQNILYTIFMVFFSFLTQYFRAKSVFLCSPALVQPFGYIAVILGILVDIFILGGSQYNLMMVLGVLLTSMGLFTKIIMAHLSK